MSVFLLFYDYFSYGKISEKKFEERKKLKKKWKNIHIEKWNLRGILWIYNFISRTLQKVEKKSKKIKTRR